MHKTSRSNEISESSSSDINGQGLVGPMRIFRTGEPIEFCKKHFREWWIARTARTARLNKLFPDF